MTDKAVHRELTHYDQPVLHNVTELVENIASDEVQQLIADMFLTMKKEHGVGLAATQIGLGLRLAVIEAEGQQFTVINPEILKKSSSRIAFTEGCLSIPGKEFPVIRHEKITVRYTDEHGRTQKIKLKGFLAIVFQHEIDHLDGKLIADRFEEQEGLRKDYYLH